MNNYEWVIKYRKHNWSCIPLGKDKRPIISEWKKYQTEYASDEQLKEWFDIENAPNIGIVTGKISNLTVVDVELGGNSLIFPATMSVKTGNGGVHLYYKNADVRNYVRTLPLVDIRGEGGYVVAAPSVTEYLKDGVKVGGAYEWLRKEDEQPFPYQMFNLSPANNNDWEKLLTGVQSGSRNETAAKVIGKFFNATSFKDWNTVAWDMTVLWNQRNKPPLGEKELRSTFNSIAGTRVRSGKLNDASSNDISILNKKEEDICDIKLISEIAQSLTDDITLSYPTGFQEYDKAFMGGVKEGDMIILTGHTGQGKCHGKGTKILMYDGTIKNVEDVVIGDKLMGDDSKPRNVLSLARGREMLYKVSHPKTESYTINESHILSLRGASRTHYYADFGKTIDIPLAEYLKKGTLWKQAHSSYKVPVQFKKKNLKIEPYFLGLWLGDGSSKSSEITSMDREIHEYLFDFASRYNYKYKIKHNPYPNKSSLISIVRKTTNTPKRPDMGCVRSMVGKSLQQIMREMSLLGNKHIPLEYKTSSRKDRLNLLAGLIDSDGHVDFNCIEISSKFPTLADDIVYLARSLGFWAYHKNKKVKFKNKILTYKRIKIWGDCPELPVLLKRKKLQKRKQIKNHLNYGIKTEKLGVGDYYGFEIDGNHRYLLGDFTVTHNTLFMQSLAYNFVKSGQPILFFSYEVPIGELWRKFKDMGVDNSFQGFAPEKSVNRKLDWVCEKIKDSRDRFKTKIVFIDHLGFLMEEPTNYDSNIANNLSTILTLICRRLKSIAIQENIVIVLAHHLRKPASGKTEESTSHDLKDSTGVGQESDAVVIVRRKKMKKGYGEVGDTYESESIILIDKNRRTGINKSFEVTFNKGRLEDIDDAMRSIMAKGRVDRDKDMQNFNYKQ